MVGGCDCSHRMQPRGAEYNVVRRLRADHIEFNRAGVDLETDCSHYYFGGTVETGQSPGGWFYVA